MAFSNQLPEGDKYIVLLPQSADLSRFIANSLVFA
jgi:hypothetical protein